MAAVPFMQLDRNEEGTSVQRRKTILLIDDVALFRDLGALFLARTARVVTARNAEEGLELARRDRPDIVVVDLLMPDLDGEQFCLLAKADPQLVDIPVIVLAGSDDPEDRGRAIRAGAEEVLPKPIARVTLVQAVNRVMRVPGFRGLPRITVEAPIEFAFDDQHDNGMVRNLSRGGLFLETAREIPTDKELQLRFELPDNQRTFEPTAKVVWRQVEASRNVRSGVGMRFVAFEGGAIRNLEDYVTERLPEPMSPRLGGL